MARTNAVNVGKIIKVKAGDDLTPFIEVANGLVTQFCAGESAYSADWLEQIERWLAAHFYCTFRRRRTQEQAGTVGQSLESVIKIGLDNSHYGQQAKLLDWLGGLANLDTKITGTAIAANIRWLGYEDD